LWKELTAVPIMSINLAIKKIVVVRRRTTIPARVTSDGKNRGGSIARIPPQLSCMIQLFLSFTSGGAGV
jgi:hypothetical protein